MRPGCVIIKKYGNRRMYDTSASRYINLEDIATLVRNGNDVQVVDAKTGADLTRVTLTQIIMEDAKEQPAGLPLEMLRQIILASNHAGRDFIMWYLKSAFDAYQKVQGAVHTGLSDIRSAATSPLQMMKSFIDDATSSSRPDADEVEELRKRVAELEAGSSRRRPARKSGNRRRTQPKHTRNRK